MKWSRRTADADMRREIAHHIECRAADLEAAGATPAEAMRQARAEFGAIGRYTEECRESLGYRPLDELSADLRYAIRGALRTPGFAFVSVAVLALAIAANAAFFTLYDNYVLRPLSIPHPERNFDLVKIDATGRRGNSWTPADLEQLRTAAHGPFADFYSEGTFQIQLVAPVRSGAMSTVVTPSYFPLLGALPAKGRLLQESDQGPVAVLSDHGWQRLFAHAPDVIGRRLQIRNTIFTVVGVTAPAFVGTTAVVPDFWIGFNQRSALRADLSADSTFNLSGVLREGADHRQAAAALSTLVSRLSSPFGRESALRRVDLEARQSILPRDPQMQTAAALVFAVFLLVLLIACANLANLHLARAASRTREIAIRLSLGASRARVVRQLLTESTLLALLGAAAGLGLARALLAGAERYLISSAPFAGVATPPVALDWRIFLFTAIIGIAAGIAFGLAPALEATAPRSHASAHGKPHAGRLRNALISAQSAASLVLLILAAVLVSNTQRLATADTGFSLDEIFDTRIEHPTAAQLERLRTMPAVAAASAIERTPLYGPYGGLTYLVNGASVTLASAAVDHNFLTVLAAQPVQGRFFTAEEALHNADVAVISAATTRRLWPGEGSVTGRTIRQLEPERVLTVVGVAPDFTTGFVFQGRDRALVYTPIAAGSPEAGQLLVRGRGNAAATIAALRSVDPTLDPLPLRSVAALQQFPFRIAAGVSGALGLLALALTCIGLYGVVGFLVAQRTREIGLRVALGAAPLGIVRTVLSGASRQVLIGLAIALPLCLALARLAAAGILQLQTFAWSIYLGAPTLLWIVAVGSCLRPARRAARVDPAISLRVER